MKRIIYTILLVLISSTSIQAQRESNIWHFGRNTGLDFNNVQSVTSTNHGVIHGIPKEIRGAFVTNEGCFSISDGEGNFLFSSDGRVAYNRNNVAMENGGGLLGHPSSAQSGIVVPVPGSKTKYYLFTCPELGATTTPYAYSIVDMERDNKLGGIVAGEKNKPLPLTGSGYAISHCSENLTVVKHANDKDYWLVAMVWEHFLVWKISEAGISNPTKFLIPNGHKMRAQSNVKFSPDGTMVVYASNNSSKIAFANFDPSSGIMSNMKCTETGLKKTYGIEFSPNGKYVFLTRIEYPSYTAPTDVGLFIRKVTELGVTDPTISGKKVLNNITNVQLGPDKRIYAITGTSLGAGKIPDRNLYVILNPDEGGTQIAEIKNFFDATRTPVYGLPPFITSYFSLKGIHGEVFPCVSKDYVYEAYLIQGSAKYEIDYLEWDFGDGTPKVKQHYKPNVATYQQTYKYNSVGDFKMLVRPYNKAGELIESSILVKDMNTRVCTVIVNPANRSFYKKTK